MVEIVIALLMYIGVDLQEHVPYDNIGDCLKAKRLSERKEAWFRIIVLIVSGVILGIWHWVLGAGFSVKDLR